MAHGRTGAQRNVLRFMAESGKITHVSIPEIREQTAFCTLCKSRLDFIPGPYGQTLEQCTNRDCLLHRAHRMIPDLTYAPPTQSERQEAKRDERRARALARSVANELADALADTQHPQRVR